MGIAEPDIGDEPMDTDDDDDDEDESAKMPSKTTFTQSLMLFVRLSHHRVCARLAYSCHATSTHEQSQVQGGHRYRYSPHLTRFFTSLLPYAMLGLIQDALTELDVKQNPAKEILPEYPEDGAPMIRMRIGTKDRRRIHMKGYVEIEELQLEGYQGSFIVFARDAVSAFRVFSVRSGTW